MRHHEFCATDPFFYDLPDPGAPGSGSFAASAPGPEGWAEDEAEVWRTLWPPEARLPAQGWKIHVSATLDNAERVLTAVHRYCLRRRIAFKHLRSRRQLLRANAKYATRGGSGKFITLYPADERQLRTTLDELGAELAGEDGPYILSDLRYGAGPLYLRYGGFARRWVDTGEARVTAIERPDGTLVADRREPRFQVPDWVNVPDFLAPHLAARTAGGQPSADQFPYTVTEALHFSNGGGVYRATRRGDGQEVVLKEARPHAGLDGAGHDAVYRLRHEYQVLRRLAGVPGVVTAERLHTVWEHHFLVMRAAPGVALKRWLAEHYPQNQLEASERDVTAYTGRALAILEQVTAVVARIHRRGVVIGDLHPGNIMVDEHDQVTLIDFEVATDAPSHSPPPHITPTRSAGGTSAGGRLGAPGFRAPAGRVGPAADRYALAVLRLWLFLPLAPVLELAPGKAHSWLEFVTRRFGLPPGFGESVLAELGPAGPLRPVPGWTSGTLDQNIPAQHPPTQIKPAQIRPAPEEPVVAEPVVDWPVLRARIVEGILASATPQRTDRLFPGDPYQFEAGPTGFAHGAAGVLYALHAVGAGRYPDHERWLLDAVRRDPPAWPGFSHGAHGVAAVLDCLGYPDEADRLVDRVADEIGRTRDPSLEGGLAGIGLGLLGLSASRHHTSAVAVAERLAERLTGDQSEKPGPTGGLRRGWSGAALLFCRVFEHTGELPWLELADRAVRRDLGGCVPTAGDGLQVLDQWGRSLSYLDTGVAGIALAAAALAGHAPGAPSVAALPKLLRGCHSEFVIQPGLAQGRSGLLLALATARPWHTDQRGEWAIRRHLTHLAWHAVEHRGAVAFPGHQLLRLSMDLATGGAGVLLGLHAALAQPSVRAVAVLPFLGVHRRPTLSTP